MLNYQLIKTKFDSDYIPDPRSRNTTNLVNLAKNPLSRKENIENFLSLINQIFNDYLSNSNANQQYKIELEILTTLAWFDEHKSEKFPISEMLAINLTDLATQTTIQGPIGLNFSSYLRDYDFHVILQDHKQKSKQGRSN